MRLILVAINASYPHTNLALRLIRSRVPAAWECTLFERYINLPRGELTRELLRLHGDCVGFSCYIWNRELCMKLGAAIKRARPETFVYFGGPEAENDPMPFLSCGDAVCRGEGEATISALLEGVASGDLSRVPGLVTRNFSNPIAPPLQIGDWADAYPAGAENLRGRIVYIETSRGCPYRCGYCLSAGDKVRALDADEAVRRLIALADSGVSLIKLVDRTFNFDRARAAQIWRRLIEHHAGGQLHDADNALPVSTYRKLAAGQASNSTRYHFEIAANLLDQEAFDILSHAPEGLFQFEAGIQSTNEDTLRAVGRSAATEEIMENVRRVVALGTIPVHVDLIAGLPYEDLDSFARSFDQAWALHADMLQLGFLKLLPGSRLRREAEHFGITYDPAPPYEVLRTPWLSCDDLCLLHDVEKIMDWFDGLCPLAMDALSRRCGPFSARRELAMRLRKMGAFDRDMTQKDRISALLKLHPDMADLIAHDLLLRARPLPRELDISEDETLRALLRAHFHPIRGQRARKYALDPRPGSEREGSVVLLYANGRCFAPEDSGSST